jgi:hypothetical protein
MNSNDDNDICRDFVRGVCGRGLRCRFKHTSDEALATAAVSDTVLTASRKRKLLSETRGDMKYCRDFQRGYCRRASDCCRFSHEFPNGDDHLRNNDKETYSDGDRSHASDDEMRSLDLIVSSVDSNCKTDVGSSEDDVLNALISHNNGSQDNIIVCGVSNKELKPNLS